MDCWHILGIAPTRDEAAIKRAYAQLLKKHRPENHYILVKGSNGIHLDKLPQWL